MHKRHRILLLTFVLVVITPMFVAAGYLYGVARDQYASYVGFSVRKEEGGSALELLGGFTQISGSSSSDTDILFEYIQSQEMVRTIDKRLDLAKIFTKSYDPWFSLGSDTRIEALSAYWQRMVKVSNTSGLIDVRALTFSPEDSQAITQAIFEESSNMINKLSDIAREDATRFARKELDGAIVQLKLARTALTAFRSRTQLVDPAADVAGRMGLLNNLQKQLAEALIELDLLRTNTAKSDPRVMQAEQKVAVIRERIAAERDQFGRAEKTDPAAFPNLVSEYESLSVDQSFAEKKYLSALATYDGAVADAQRKSRYLATHIPPTLPETAEYPRRMVFLLALGGMLAIGWSIMVMIYYSLRDRR